MPINPLSITGSISSRYLNYLQTTFQINHPELGKKFKESLLNHELIKGPIIEATPPFKEGRTIQHLIDEGTLSSFFSSLNQKALPVTRNLYLHQEQAIQKSVKNNRNIVVATGTGSGKTEIFMITILNYLFHQQKTGKLGPGVRALILYPMNALVNDQLIRLRQLLKDTPFITFGRYTGETLEQETKAIEKFQKLYKEKPLSNERISREKMRESPPHILLTNYAMLEYLLLRPSDNCFFDGPFAKEWRFLVLDEAHTYNGAKGIEMAMLLRRLKDRVVRSEPNRLQCIATSATLGKGVEDYPDVAKFASDLFGEHFNKDDIIGAEREDRINLEGWGVPEPRFYDECIQWLSDEKSSKDEVELAKIAVTQGVSSKIVTRALSKSNGNSEKFLFLILEGDDRLIQLKKTLLDGPKYLDNLYSSDYERDTLIKLIELAAKVRQNPSDSPLLSARYHLFVRSVEGAYIQFFPKEQFFFKPIQSNVVDNHVYPVFELGSCKYCGVPYILGVISDSNGIPVLKQKPENFFDEETEVQYFLLSPSISSDNKDEDDEIELGEKIEISGIDYILCGRCGSIDKASRVKPACSCGKEYQIHVKYIQTNKRKSLQKCPFCTKVSPGAPVVSRFFMGRDAIPSVLATAIYQELHCNSIEENIPTDVSVIPHDQWDPPALNTRTNSVSSLKMQNKRQKFLVFSDSRQDAAYFAPYLQQTYDKILRRALFMCILHDKAEAILKNQWTITDFHQSLINLVDRFGLLGGYTAEEREREIHRWLMYEFIFGRSKGSLEELGLVCFRLQKPAGWVPPPQLKEEPWGLTDDEIWTLFNVLLDSFRLDGAIRFPEGISPTDDFFQPRNFQFYYRENGSSRERHILSWAPRPEYSNKRLNYLLRLVEKLGIDVSEEECREVLHGIWRYFGIGGYSPLSSFFITESLGSEGIGILMDPKRWVVTSSHLDSRIQWYECDRCHVLTTVQIRSVCPTYRCKGTLHPIDPTVMKKDNHYRLLYTELEPLPMRVEEHTAQLTNEAATNLQQQFLDGEVNILSCSTTFELGVDVGELETVFMRNMPPTAANYIQRAGRAGRRTNAAAFVTTFCQRRPHDLSHFNDPMSFVKGIISPPFFMIENEKIIKRHVFATAIAEFWRRHPDTFNDVESFFFNDNYDVPAAFQSFLRKKPADLKDALLRIVPEQMVDALDIPNWGFIEDLFYDRDQHPEKGLLTKAQMSVSEDVNDLEKVYHERVKKYQRVDPILNLIRTIKKRPIIDYLSSHNIIPKYGFPIDVVELQVLYPSESARKLELQRDLKIALSEYAPGSQVVAAGSVWESQYVKINPKRNWLKYRYYICNVCNRYQSILSEKNKELGYCNACGADLQESRNKGEFIIPEFGFVCSTIKPKKVTDKRPQRSFATRPYFSGECTPEETITIPFKNDIFIKAESASRGELAIINNAGGMGFEVCTTCGYAFPAIHKLPKTHKNAFDRVCNGQFMHVALGHQYLTDILKIEFVGYSNTNQDFWFSLLYSILEGMSESMGINRDDIDGCLYPIKGKQSEPALVLFDTVPGGAGHVRRAIKPQDHMISILQAAYDKMSRCTCGSEQGHSSCYGCLRNYHNQFCHEFLDRMLVIDFLERLGVQKDV